MPLFGKSQKSPAEVVKALKEAVSALERGDKKAEKAQEDVSKNLVLMKNMLYGTSDAEPQTDIMVAQLAQELYNSNLLLLLIQNLNRIDFEVCFVHRSHVLYITVMCSEVPELFVLCCRVRKM